MIDSSSTLEDVCFAVHTALDRHGIVAVLCGGSAATVYAPAHYTSEDADFVLENDESLAVVAEALRETGFLRTGSSRIFAHPETRYTLDFPRGPLAVGGDYVRNTDLMNRNDATLRIVNRTDCVRDRLAHFYFWNDFTALNTAVAIAASAPELVDLKLIRSWTLRESSDLAEKLAEFERRLKGAIQRSL